MGLDMYLSKRYYVRNWDHMKESEKHHITIMKGDKPSNIPTDKIIEITVDMGYWRKANQIHQWFVENVQDGVDDCRDYWVPVEKLEELLKICKKVHKASELVDGKVSNGWTYEDGDKKNILVEGKIIKDPTLAKELLPSQEGFFFGNTDYDEYYLQDINNTIKILTEALKDKSGEFYYHSSW